MAKEKGKVFKKANRENCWYVWSPSSFLRNERVLYSSKFIHGFSVNASPLREPIIFEPIEWQIARELNGNGLDNTSCVRINIYERQPETTLQIQILRSRRLRYILLVLSKYIYSRIIFMRYRFRSFLTVLLVLRMSPFSENVLSGIFPVRITSYERFNIT